jgi:hypothetical protein
MAAAGADFPACCKKVTALRFKLGYGISDYSFGALN